MKKANILSTTKSEIRAMAFTITCICLGVLLPPFISSVSHDLPSHDVSVLISPLLTDTVPMPETKAAEHKGEVVHSFHKPKPQQPEGQLTTQLDINSATLSDLTAFNGIGEKLGARIIKFRDKLGGFHSIDQVGETYGLKSETFAAIRPHLQLGTAHKTITLNQASEWQLASHAYISREQAVAIHALVQQHDSSITLADLRSVGNQEWIDKLEPYLKTGS